MAFQLFQFPLPADPELHDLNSFLASHRVVGVQRELVTTQAGTMLLFVVEWVSSAQKPDVKAAGTRIDYRETLGDVEFLLFDRLRDVRKSIGDTEGVPLYAVFSNAQLAAMVQEKCTTAAQILLIEGIGKARVDKYAAAFLPVLEPAFAMT